MSDIRKRVTTGIFASFGLYVMLEVYPILVMVYIIVFHLTAQEYYDIMKKTYKNHLPSEMINNISSLVPSIYIIPIIFSYISTFPHKEGLLCFGFILTLFFCITFRLFQYSSYCGISRNPDPMKSYSFACLVTIFGDILFCVFIGFPFSYLILLMQLE